MKIVYLYSEIAPYLIPIFKELVSKFLIEIHIISWDKKKLKPYVPPKIDNVFYYTRNSFFTDKEILNFVKKIDPTLIYISGWMDKGYFLTALEFKRKNIPIVIGFDDQWKGTFRQKLGSIYYKIFYNKYFSHAWVSGVRQYEYAKHLGFKNENIIFDMLTCDLELFEKSKLLTKNVFPKIFLYVGNFRDVKGIDILISAFNKYRDNYNGNWKLICIGNGKLDYLLKEQKNVLVIPFQNQKKLLEYAENSGVFILPSRHEQWGVVVHEFCAAGMPLILSDNVGSKDTFFIENFNGYSFSNNSIDELTELMCKITKKSDVELFEMGFNSKKLSQRISPATSAANLVSLLKK